MAFAIKAAIEDPTARTFTFDRQKTMYGGKQIAPGDTIFLFASEKDGGHGLIARGTVTSAASVDRIPDVDRQTPRVSVVIERTALAKQAVGRDYFRRFADWDDGRPESEINFKFYRQSTNKIVGISDAAAAFLDGFC